MNRFATDVKLIRKSRKEKKMNVLEIKGNVNTALCYAKVVEDEAIEQIKRMCDYAMSEKMKLILKKWMRQHISFHQAMRYGRGDKRNLI